MADRFDPSQYPEDHDYSDNPAYSGMGDQTTFPVNQGMQETPDSVAMTSFTEKDIPDIMRLFPEIFQTQGSGKSVKETRYRQIAPGISVTGVNYLLGLAVREVSGAVPAKFNIRDGMDVSGPIVLPVNLAANESRSDYLPFAGGIKFERGIYIEIVSGTVEGTLFTEVNRNV